MKYEGKYAKMNGFSVQTVVLKMSKKRALVDAVLNVGNLSARFTQDVEDMNIEPDRTIGRSPDELSSTEEQSTPSVRKASAKQIQFLERLMKKHNTAVSAMNKYVSEHYDVNDYRNITANQASELIEKYKAVGE